MKKVLLSMALASMTLAASATPRAAMLIGYPTVNEIDNFQEEAAALFFRQSNPDGVIIAPGETSKINAENIDCIWVHIDRLNAGKGQLPEAFGNAGTLAALKKFVEDGGNLFLTKQATQLVSKIGRTEEAFAPNIYDDGDGGEGTDNWTVNAQIGYWFVNEKDNPVDLRPEQYYDHRGHAIYQGLETNNDFPMETFGLLGTGNGSVMWRENHNCLWDLNAYSYTSEGANTVEKFQNQTTSLIIGTWGHVQDHAVAGIIEFLPTASYKGKIIANGLAAYEWAPRQGTNAYASNIEKLTGNTVSYLVKPTSTNIDAVINDSEDTPAEYFNLQGMRVDGEMLRSGIYIMRRGTKTAKVYVK